MLLHTKKDPFPKSIANACRVLAGWKNRYGGRDNHNYDANDGIYFATTGAEEPRKMLQLQEDGPLLQ